MSPPRIATIGAHQSFLDVLARRWLDQAAPGDPMAVARGLILLPTRRAARSLHEAFLRATNGKPLLLPRIEAIGAPDEMPFALRGVLDVPQSIGASHRLALLSRLILALNGAAGAPTSADRAWPLAASLAQLLDEAARAEIDLRHALDHMVDAEFAVHWQQITKFLSIVTEYWPRELAKMGLADIADRQVALLRTEADRWDTAPPSFPVWAAGSTGGIGAVARLLSVVARMPQGQVVLPGLDLAMEATAWDAIEPGHPQASLQQLLSRMGATRDDVVAWETPDLVSPASRTHALNLALRPAACLPDWRQAAPLDLGDVSILEPGDQQSEAMAIAIALRQGLNTPGARVALITPDRTLAGRVAAELTRFGVVADDSAGEPLADTPPALFLRLLIEAVRTGLAPVALLAWLKHPLTALGMKPFAAREAARRLERACLRGPAPAPWIEGLRQLAGASEVADNLLDRLEHCIAPLIRLFAQPAIEPGAFLATLIGCAEAAAGSDETPGAQFLWALEEGEALSQTLAELRTAFEELPPQDPGALPGLLAAALSGASVRSRRALRGREAGSEHPRVFIWGLLEARLQTVDLAVLGGLVESVWPPVADPGPWMNRKMRAQAGLPSPEETIEQAAHDFVMAACCAPKVILSIPQRRDGAPAVPARFVTRLHALLRGWQRELPHHPALDWAHQIDRTKQLTPAPRPEPRPPLKNRPRSLSVTDVELWFNDPYALYAKKILRLPRLDPLEQNADHADFGNLVHTALCRFFTKMGEDWPQEAADLLAADFNAAIDSASLRPSIAAWWRPRLTRIARFIDQSESLRRANTNITARHLEIKGKLLLGDFELHGRADRIERIDQDQFAIIDYKTGAVPSQSQVESGFAPQLPLEAMMLERGAFAKLDGEVRELAFWKLSGGREPGRVVGLWPKEPGKIEESVEDAYAALRRQIENFANPDQAYLSAPDPRRNPRFSDYTLLARRGEWAALDKDAADDEGAP